jgi:glycosyltransferase involved in cell wall biosynthesis
MSTSPTFKNSNFSLSIIIPTYNDAHLLKKCLNSLLQQSFLPEEIIVIDDGSDNNLAQDICRLSEYSLLSINYTKIENSGPANARNFGFNQASSEFIIFLDVDDALPVGAIESYVSNLDALESDSFGLFGRIKFNFPYSSRTTKFLNFSNIDFNQIGRKNLFEVHISAFLFRRKYLQEVGGFRPSLSHNEDFDLLLRMCQLWKFFPINALTLHKNFRSGSQSNKNYLYSYEGVNQFLSIAKTEGLLSKKEILLRQKQNTLTFGKRSLINLQFQTAGKSFRKAFTFSRPDNFQESVCHLLSILL